MYRLESFTLAILIQYDMVDLEIVNMLISCSVTLTPF